MHVCDHVMSMCLCTSFTLSIYLLDVLWGSLVAKAFARHVEGLGSIPHKGTLCEAGVLALMLLE